MDPSLEEELLPHLDPAEEVEAMMRLNYPDQVPDNVRVVSSFGDIITCRIRRSLIPEVYASPLKKSLKASRYFTLQYPESIEPVSKQSPLYFDSPDLKLPTGKGVVIAVLDWGIDFAHSSFLNKDGTTRFRAIWDQSVDEPGVDPYGYGRLYTREEINAALKAENPYNALGYHPAKADFLGIGAHGTHVADIAGGNKPRYKGHIPASDAELIFIHMSARNAGGLANLGDATRILEAIDMASRFAGEDPLVINLSMGKHGGSHDGTSLVELGMDNFVESRPNTMICQSVGNYYLSNAHSKGIVRPGKKRSFRFYVDKADKTPNELEIWYSGKDEFGVRLKNNSTGEVFANRKGSKTTMTDEYGTIYGRIYHRTNEPNNGKNHINIFLYRASPPGIWEVELTGDVIIDGRYHAWVERDSNCRGCKVVFAPEDSDKYYTNGSICNGHNTIVVGAYNARDPVFSLAPFSSQGPTVDGRFKPDIIAPGVRVPAAKSTPKNAYAPQNQFTVMSGTSMAAPHVANTVALLLEILPRGTVFWQIRNLIMGTADASKRPTLRSGTGRLNQAAAVAAARKIASGLSFSIPGQLRQPTELKHQNNMEYFDSENIPDLEIENESNSDISETRRALGSFKLLSNASPTRVHIEDTAPIHSGNSFDDALEHALARTGERHSVILGDLFNPGNYRVFDHAHQISYITRSVIESNIHTSVCCLVLNARDVYVDENSIQGTNRWVLVPRMREYYSLAANEQTSHRNRWIRRLNSVRNHINVPGQTVDRSYLQSLSALALRILLAMNAEHSYEVHSVRRNNRDTGGRVDGTTKPLFKYPLDEPDCYFAVISQAEGAMESINAWDYQAGISIGPIQFNAQRGAIHRWLHMLFTRDRALFDRELGNHYRWTMSMDNGQPVLNVNQGTPNAFELRGTNNNEVRRSYGYFQSGNPANHAWAQIDPDFRREMAGRFARVLAWPHVQEMVLEVSSWWSQRGLNIIQNAGIGALNTTNPDHDAFVLKSILMSAYVRYSGCLQPLINRLNAYATIALKLQHWETALNGTSTICQRLRNRLRRQVNHADTIHAAILRTRTVTRSADHETEANPSLTASERLCPHCGGQLNELESSPRSTDIFNSNLGNATLENVFKWIHTGSSELPENIRLLVHPGESIDGNWEAGDLILQRSESGKVFAHRLRDTGLKAGEMVEASYSRPWLFYVSCDSHQSGKECMKSVSEDGIHLLSDQAIIRISEL